MSTYDGARRELELHPSIGEIMESFLDKNNPTTWTTENIVKLVDHTINATITSFTESDPRGIWWGPQFLGP